MNNFETDFSHFAEYQLDNWVPYLKQGLENRLEDYKHGQLDEWKELLASLPEVIPSLIELENELIIGKSEDISKTQHHQLKQELLKLHPWRKGPFTLFGEFIDCEWRSDWKWQRLQHKISSLKNRRVLDIGCGNGFHLWKMIAAGARCAIGIDPSQLFWAQFQVFKKYLPEHPVHLIPVGIEQLPESESEQGFDSIFCMGVLYHRRSPIDTLMHLRKLLRKGGELVLETLVIEGDENQVLLPEGRYAQMRNVWFLPSVAALELWMQRCGFINIETINVETTSTDEQRQTEWMTYHSLQQFLDPKDSSKTVEGLPAPRRAIITAIAP